MKTPRLAYQPSQVIMAPVPALTAVLFVFMTSSDPHSAAAGLRLVRRLLHSSRETKTELGRPHRPPGRFHHGVFRSGGSGYLASRKGEDVPTSSNTAKRHEECLDRYARLLVEHSLGLREGQPLTVRGEWIHRDLALRVGEAAYSVGAGKVDYRLVDPLETAQLIRRGRPEQIALHEVERQTWLNDVLRTRGALLLLDGKSDPQMMAELRRTHPRNHGLLISESSAIGVELTRRVIDQRLSPVVTAVCPTPAWASRVFPELDGDEAYRRLWELIFRSTHALHDDASARAEVQVDRLATRCRALDSLDVEELHVTGGGNDFRVRFTDRTRWRDASARTTSGQRFFVNVPSFEVFTTPDRHGTEGRLSASRPLPLHGGALVEGLVLHFRGGRIVDFEAERGAEDIGSWLDVDDGSRHLGEFALVAVDSPVGRGGRTFGNTLLDENAAAHVALGQAYASALDGGETMSASELEAVGCNRSTIHVDVAFGSAEVDVVATPRRGGETVVLTQGSWAPGFS